jgi:hypothetical protein
MRLEGGHIIYRGEVEDVVEILAHEIRNFRGVFDQPLAQALQHYLGLTDVRYILVRYYKAFEKLAEALGGTTAALKQLAPLGIAKTEQRSFSAPLACLRQAQGIPRLADSHEFGRLNATCQQALVADGSLPDRAQHPGPRHGPRRG